VVGKPRKALPEATAVLVWQRVLWVKDVHEVMRKRDGRNKNMGLGNLGDLSNLDLGQLQQYLPNLNFPASKDEVISEVQNNDAPQEVVDQIKNSKTDTFNNADEVLQTVRGNK
jgi:hypothetical protein